MKKWRKLLILLRSRFEPMTFPGRLGVLFCFLYAIFLTSYHITGDVPNTRAFATIAASNSAYIYVAIYLILVGLALWWPVRGSTAAMSFIGVQGIVTSVQPFNLTSCVVIMVYLIFPSWAIYGLIDVYRKQNIAADLRTEYDKLRERYK